MLKIVSDAFVTPDGLRGGLLFCEGGKIVRLSGADGPADEVLDLTGLTVLPGFVDLHTHGGGGHPFISCTPEDVAAACDFHLSHGTTTILPTVTAGPFPVMRAAVGAIAEARLRRLTRARIAGVHLEGPYLSAAQCGAQCPDFITPPRAEDYLPLAEQYGRFLRRWTYAPEADPDGSFCRFLASRGILPSAGHTDAVWADVHTAVENGCRLVTHLYSCTSTVTRDHGFRSAGVIESCFLEDNLTAELIADGRHLPPELIRLVLKVKGADRVTVCTDSLAIAGTDVREGEMSGTRFVVEDGVCKLRDRSAFAGSIASADVLLRVLVRDCGLSLPEASRLLSRNPARLIGEATGELVPGFAADLVAVDADLSAAAVVAAGTIVRTP